MLCRRLLANIIPNGPSRATQRTTSQSGKRSEQSLFAAQYSGFFLKRSALFGVNIIV